MFPMGANIAPYEGKRIFSGIVPPIIFKLTLVSELEAQIHRLSHHV